jgi:hypothetical protein
MLGLPERIEVGPYYVLTDLARRAADGAVSNSIRE